MRVPSVDEQFAIEEGRYRFFVTITFPDTTTMRIDEDKIWDDGFEIDRSVSGQNTFELGACVVGQFKLTLNNAYGDFDNVSFYGAVAEPCVEFYGIPDWKIYGTWSFGLFNVDEIDSNNTFVKLTCLDDMVKFDIPLTSVSGVPYAMTYWQLLSGMCTEAGVATTVTQISMQNMRYAISGISSYMLAIPQGYTEMSCRDALVAMCASLGAYAYIDEAGKLSIKQFDDTWLKATSTSRDYYEANYPSQYHDFTPANMTKFNRDDGNITISGVTVIDDYDKEFSAGTAGYVIELDKNWCIWTTNTGTVSQSYANGLYAMLGVANVRPFKATHLADMTIEVGDNVLIEDEFGGLYKSVILRTAFKARGQQESECVAEPGAVANAARYTESAKAVAKMTAALLPYSDGNTQLGATNTQAAIEAVNTKANNAASAASALIGDPSYTSGGTVAAVSGAWKAVQSVELSAGIWIAEYGMSFASNANGYRAITFNTSSSSASITRNALTAAAVSGEATVIQGSVTLLLTEATTHYLWAYQNSGGSLNTYPFIRVTKLK